MRDTAIIKIKFKTTNDIRFKGTYKEFKTWFKSYYIDVNPGIHVMIKINMAIGKYLEKQFMPVKEIKKLYTDEFCDEFYDFSNKYYYSRLAYDKMMNNEFNFEWLKKEMPNLFCEKGWDYEVIDV